MDSEPVVEIRDVDVVRGQAHLLRGVDWTVLADERKVRLWRSEDLKTWERLSDFGPAGSVRGVWECPELFEAPVEGTRGETRWVLKVDVNDGALVVPASAVRALFDSRPALRDRMLREAQARLLA